MTFYLIVWVSFSCPWGLGRLPAQLKAAICSQTLQYEFTSSRSVAESKVQELGPSAGVTWLEIRGGRISKREVDWRARIK